MKVAENTKKKEAHRITNPVQPSVLTLKDAAIYLGKTPWGLRELVWKGHVPFIQYPGGRKMYFDIKDLDQAKEDNKKRYV
ncbi:MAG: hypothetical protein ACLP3B_03525 [Syntrophobacteraceae bacterium]